jgi:hypothetical protein
MRVFRWLLNLYPVSFFREFSEEMSLCFHLRLQEARQQGWRKRVPFFVREFWGVFTGAMSEQLGYRFDLFGRFDMRSFRFSRFAMVSMILALIGVAIAIEIARRQSIALTTASELIAEPAWVIFSRTLSGLLKAIVIAGGILGGLGYAVLRVVGRSGSDRLANAKTWPQERQSPRI